jgi:pimeloyl-ACP methyl ester carboxylesterase
VFDALSRRHRTIAFDLRGHGGSGKPHDLSRYGREMAYDIVRLLDHLDIARAHVVGYSLGAHVVAQLLTLEPGRFLSAVLAAGTGRRRWSADDDARVEAEAAELESGSLRAQLARLRPPGRPPLTDAQVRAHSARLLAGNDPHALAAIRRANRQQVIATDALSAVDVPVLGVVGSRDPYRSEFAALSQRMPQLELVEIEGATHDSLLAVPEFAEALLRFLARHADAMAPS